MFGDTNGGFTFKGVTAGGDVDLDPTSVANLFTTTTDPTTHVATLTAVASAATGDGPDVAGSLDVSAINSGNTYTAGSAGTTSGPSGKLGNVSVNLTATGALSTGSATPAYTSVNVYGDGSGGYTFKGVKADGTEDTTTDISAALTGTGGVFDTTSGGFKGKGALVANTNSAGSADGVAQANAQNQPPKVSDIDLTKANGANLAIESIDNALDSVNSIQADLGAAQNRFSSIASTQTAQSTNLSSAQSQITDANFAQETANLSKAQVLQQAGISVLAQANSMPQQVLKLLG
ncbi:flagellin [Caballeronia hypogeia]|uniref:flagellin n=1 Tax=Caballeronia hypogeia TaxID=1777140 RepID=UPI0035B5415E